MTWSAARAAYLETLAEDYVHADAHEFWGGDDQAEPVGGTWRVHLTGVEQSQDEAIASLRCEAIEAGDTDLAERCVDAAHDMRARARCLETIMTAAHEALDAEIESR